MSFEELHQLAVDTLLRLSLIEGFTVEHLRRLRSVASHAPRLPGIPAPRGSSLVARAEAALSSPEAGRKADEVMEACVRSGVAVLPCHSPEYPPALLAVPDAPVVLYRAGSPWRGGRGWPSSAAGRPRGPEGNSPRSWPGTSPPPAASWSAGWPGGSTARPTGARCGGGATVAVLGCGPDVAYPPEHAGLRDEIEAKGAVYSEYPPGALPLPHRFPARNRIVSGLCLGVVVAEAPERSGALITARLALEQGREVMAVPGSPWFAHTAGSNRLLREGAAPVCSAADVIGALGIPAPGGDLPSRILGALDRERHAGEIAQSLSLGISQLLPILTEMELANLVVKRAGDYYKRKS
jgi:DNA processing protein